jgi:hypothetical protein
MVGLGGINLPNPLSNKLAFLQQYGIEFGGWVANIDADGGKLLVPSLILGFIIILIFKNSTQKLNNFKLNYKTALLTVLALIGGILSLNKVSEFLYFNF